jgi:hypothetical protein
VVGYVFEVLGQGTVWAPHGHRHENGLFVWVVRLHYIQKDISINLLQPSKIGQKKASLLSEAL